MKKYTLLIISLLLLSFGTAIADNTKFTLLEQQQISIETPGLFEHSDAFQIDLSDYGKGKYSFPLPVGKAILKKNNSGLKIKTTKGDAVKSMFEGVVRLSYKHKVQGNVIVVRHSNGTETVYAHNAQNLVQVGDKVKAGQTIAIVGGENGEIFLDFSLMINGRKINPETIIDINSHALRTQTIRIKKDGDAVKLIVLSGKKGTKDLMAYTEDEPSAEKVTIRLKDIPANRWAYPLEGSKVISPYGGKRNHSGVDLKTRPNDDILAAFDGKVVRSGKFSGYGLCIEIVHANGLKTLYSHQSKNLVNVGDIVKAGQVIGLTGRTGRATTEHLHFELFCRGVRYDPARIYDHKNHCLKDITVEITNKGKITVVK